MSLTISCDTEAKQKNRELIGDFVCKHFSKTRRQKIKILCLPGWEALELTNLWHKYGIQNKNIYAVTNDSDDFKKLGEIRGLNVIFLDLYKAVDWVSKLVNIFSLTFQKTSRIDWAKLLKANGIKKNKFKNGRLWTLPLFDIIYLDIYSNYFQEGFINLGLLCSKFLKNNGIAGITYMASREKDSSLKKIVLDLNYYERQHFVADDLIRVMQGNKERSGFYPLDWLLTHYITKKHIPMGTSIAVWRKLTLIPAFQRKKKIEWCQKRLLDFDVNHINKKTMIKSDFKKRIDERDILIKQRTELIKSRNELKKEKSKIIRNFKRGWTSHQVAHYFGLKLAQARAIKAHVTMGTY